LIDPIFTTLVLPHIAALEPYAPIEPFEVLSRRLGHPPGEIVKLDANENPYGPHPAVREALAAYPFLHVYPDPEQRELRAALADYTAVPAANLLPGHGADELIDLICRITVGPGDAVIDCPPTFGMYSFDASLASARVIQIPRLSDFRLDVETIEDAIYQSTNLPVPKLLFLASPNNPDGGLLDPADLGRLLRLPLLVVVDEAYIEFAGLENSVAGWVLEHENLIVLRTFSKWAGLAGLRVGYGAFPHWLGNLLWQAKSPYNLTQAAAAAVAALDERDLLRANLAKIRAERERLARALRRFQGLTVYPSAANFLLVRVDPSTFGLSAAQICEALKEQGILVRLFEPLDSLRITIGTPEQTDTLLEALASTLGHK